MRTTIDAAGRVVIPKAIRDRLGLRGGEAIEIDEHDGEITVRRPYAELQLVRTPSGRVYFTGGPDLSWMDMDETRKLIEQSRAPRVDLP